MIRCSTVRIDCQSIHKEMECEQAFYTSYYVLYYGVYLLKFQ